MIDIAKAREICETATPGPWEYRIQYGNQCTINRGDGYPGTLLFAAKYPEFYSQVQDATFVCVARTTLPEALDEIEKLRHINEALNHALLSSAAEILALETRLAQAEPEPNPMNEILGPFGSPRRKSLDPSVTVGLTREVFERMVFAYAEKRGEGGMSRTTLFGVPAKGKIEVVSEYHNGWGSAPIIWEFIWNKYLRTPEKMRCYESYMHPKENLQSVCDLVTAGKLQAFERTCMNLTFDGCIIRKEDFPRVADDLDTMYLATYNGDYVNHLKAIATELRATEKWLNYMGCCFRHTSVSDAWTVYKKDDTGEDDCRRYDVSRDKGHWFFALNGASK